VRVRSEFCVPIRLPLPYHFAVQRSPARAVFLDRDGTLIVEKNYLSRPEDVQVFPGAGGALRRLMDAGLLLVMVTNQSGIGRGYYSEADFQRVNERLLQLLSSDGVRLARVYFAPEAPDQPSRGRKPSPQFLLDARDELGIDLGRSYMIGDKLADLECGWNAGVRQSILVRTGYGQELEAQLWENARKTLVVDDLCGAAEWILQSLRHPAEGSGG